MLNVPAGVRLIVRDTYNSASLPAALQSYDLSGHTLSYLSSHDGKVLVFAFARPALGKGDVVYTDELTPLQFAGNYNYFAYRPQKAAVTGANLLDAGYRPDVFVDTDSIMREVRRSCGVPSP